MHVMNLFDLFVLLFSVCLYPDGVPKISVDCVYEQQFILPLHITVRDKNPGSKQMNLIK